MKFVVEGSEKLQLVLPGAMRGYVSYMRVAFSWPYVQEPGSDITLINFWPGWAKDV